MSEDLKFGPLGPNCVHICVDMQRLFAEPTEWETPWMREVLPQVLQLVEPHPERCVMTRFIPLNEPGEGHGTWKRYYQRWANMTRSRLPEGMIELMPELARHAPPAKVVDKFTYSPWIDTGLQAMLAHAGVDTLIVSGGETEVCVFATVIGAIDLGYRVVLATDALCSSADSTHDAMLEIYHSRFGMQVEAVETAVIAEAWR